MKPFFAFFALEASSMRLRTSARLRSISACFNFLACVRSIFSMHRLETLLANRRPHRWCGISPYGVHIQIGAHTHKQIYDGTQRRLGMWTQRRTNERLWDRATHSQATGPANLFFGLGLQFRFGFRRRRSWRRCFRTGRCFRAGRRFRSGRCFHAGRCFAGGRCFDAGRSGFGWCFGRFGCCGSRSAGRWCSSRSFGFLYW